MSGLTKGPMPDITPPQIGGMLIGGIPIIAELLRAFGVYDLGIEQQEALSNAVTWASVLGGALIGGDAILRTGRNMRRGQVEAAAVQVQGLNAQPPSVPSLPPEPGAAAATTYSGTAATAGFEEPPKP